MYGNCFITNKLEDIQVFMPSGNPIIAIVDEADEYKYTGCIVASSFLPTYEVMDLTISGRLDDAKRLYVQWLCSPTCMELIAIILTALRSGKNICFFIDKDGTQTFDYAYQFMDHMRIMFGIIVADGICIRNGYPETPATLPDMALESSRVNAMYMYNCIDANTFIRIYPRNMIVDPNIVASIYYSHRGYHDNPEVMHNYVYGIINMQRENIPMDMICPVFRRQEVVSNDKRNS